MKYPVLAVSVAIGTFGLLPALMLTAPPAYAAPVATGQIQVIVKDALGRPLSDVAVRVSGPGGAVVATSRTNAQGRCAIPGLAAGTYTVAADKAEFQTGTAVVTLAEGATAETAITLAAKVAVDLKVQTERLNQHRNELSPETGTSIYHIDQKAVADLPRGERTEVSQVLLQAPGVVQSNFGQIFVRGDHGNVQYRLNGILLPEGITGFGSAFDMRFADKVDFITGALPAQYGLRTAGVVNIQTKTGALHPGGRVDMDLGTDGTLEPALQLGGTAGVFDYYLSGSYRQNDVGIDSPTPDAMPIHDRTQQGKGFGYLSAMVNPDTRASLIVGTSVQSFQIPNTPGQTPDFTLAGSQALASANLDASMRPANHYGILALQGILGDTVDYQLAGFGRYSGLDYLPDPVGDLQYNGVSPRSTRSSSIGGLQGDGAWRVHPAHTVRFGTILSAEASQVNNTVQAFPAGDDGKQTSTTPVTITDNGGFNAYTLGVYAQDEWKALEQLTVNYGLRFDAFGGFTSGNQISPRLGIVFKPTQGTTLHAGYARYFTPPTTELVSQRSFDAYKGTTNAVDVPEGNVVNPLPESAHYFDVGILQQILPGLSVGLDGYYKDVTNLQDEGQFSKALIYSTFNYATGRIMGLELTGSYRQDALSAYLNMTASRAVGRGLTTGQYNFEDKEREYIANNDVTLDHNQSYTASAGVAYDLFGVKLSANGVFGSGLAKGFANTEVLPAYVQFNLGASRRFELPLVGAMEARGTVNNLLDLSYMLRDGSGIGVGAPAYGPRRAFYLGLSKFF